MGSNTDRAVAGQTNPDAEGWAHAGLSRSVAETDAGVRSLPITGHFDGMKTTGNFICTIPAAFRRNEPKMMNPQPRDILQMTLIVCGVVPRSFVSSRINNMDAFDVEILFAATFNLEWHWPLKKSSRTRDEKEVDSRAHTQSS